jgi:hypothetical protein
MILFSMHNLEIVIGYSIIDLKYGVLIGSPGMHQVTNFLFRSKSEDNGTSCAKLHLIWETNIKCVLIFSR